MRIGEIYWRKDVEQFFEQWGSLICRVADRYGVDPTMMFAVFTEELSHRWPVIESGLAERIGIGGTVGPGQINVSVWSGLLDLNRDQLMNSSIINIHAVAQILRIERDRLPGGYHGTSVLMWGTRYNAGTSSRITDYGRRISNFYQELNENVKERCRTLKCRQ